MKKIFLTIAAAVTLTASEAQEAGFCENNIISSQYFQPLTPTYLDGVYVDEGWKSNWFLSIQGGLAAFVGTPVGHEDLFGRFTPLLNASIGKWITTKVAGRVSFQGLTLKDCDIITRDYQSVHADLLYNVSSHSHYDPERLPKWDCIPFFGVGMIRNTHTHQKPFAFSFGVIGRYRINERFHISAELGCTTTFQNFDGYGKSNAFGDNLLQVSAGISTTLGKVGWTRVVDPMPYIYQNDLMMEYIDQLALKERHKIHDIQRNLEYQTDSLNTKHHPKNNYSGLNALRERLKYRNEWIGEKYMEQDVQPVTKDDSTFVDKYLTFLQDKQEPVGAPVFFFFKLNTSILTDEIQHVNVEAIAKAMNKYRLSANIIGAADSQTGNAEKNMKLGQERAEYLANELTLKYNIDAQRITLYNEGGINKYKPFTANRNACVILYQSNQ